jgi:DNA ligase (NAD+)
VVAASVAAFFSLPQNQQLAHKLQQLGVRTTARPEDRVRAGEQLAGKTFVITGTLPSLTREQAAELIESHGGKVSGSVTKKTSFLLAGEAAGSKLAKATELKVPILDEAGLQRLIGAEPAVSESDAAPTDEDGAPESGATPADQLHLEL